LYLYDAPKHSTQDDMSFINLSIGSVTSSATCVTSSRRYENRLVCRCKGKSVGDFIGKFERLDEDWAVVWKKSVLEEKLRTDAPTPGRHYTDYTLLEQRYIAGKFKVD